MNFKNKHIIIVLTIISIMFIILHLNIYNKKNILTQKNIYLKNSYNLIKIKTDNIEKYKINLFDIATKYEEKNKIFNKSYDSATLLNIFINYAEQNNINILTIQPDKEENYDKRLTLVI